MKDKKGKGIEARASGDPNVKIFINADGNASFKLKSRHDKFLFDSERWWYCIECYNPVLVKSDAHEFTCPKCGYVTDIDLLIKAVEYELENEEKLKKK